MQETTIRIINVSFQIWGSLMALVMLLCMIATGRCKTKGEKLYLAIIALNMSGLLLDALAYFFRGGQGLAADIGVRVTNCCSFLSGAALSAIFLFYVKNYLEVKTGKHIKLFYRHAAIGLAMLSAAMVLINLFWPFIYEIGPDNIYRRLEMYPLLTIPPFLILMLTLWLVFSHRKILNGWEKLPLYLYIFAPVIGLIGTTLIYGIVFSQIGSTIAIVVLFVFLQIEQTNRLVKQEQELAQRNIDITLSQIQPHFLYNTLGAIRSLCRRDPKLATDTITRFSKYLKTNLDSMNLREPVYFEQEMRHVQNYLALEQIRFGERLEVDFEEIEVTDFRIPALSIQPMVENAVLHGMMGVDRTVHIQIATRTMGDTVEITITDDGAGFDVNEIKNDGKNHVGIENVRARIQYLVGGTLSIESIKGFGTKVTIRVPINKE